MADSSTDKPASQKPLEEILRDPLVGVDGWTSLCAIRSIVQSVQHQKDVPPALQSVFMLLAEAANLGILVSLSAPLGQMEHSNVAKAIVEATMILTGEAAGEKKQSVVSHERHGANVLRILNTAHEVYKDVDESGRERVAKKTSEALERLVGFGTEDGQSIKLPSFVTTPGPSRLQELTKEVLQAMGLTGRPPKDHRSPNAVLLDLMVMLGIQEPGTMANTFKRFLSRCRERVDG